MEEALFLAKFAESVTVVHRRDELRASEIMTDRARNHDSVEFVWNTELLAIDGSQGEGVTDATLVSHPDGYPAQKYEAGEDVKVEEVDIGGVFYAIGHEPNTDFLRDTPVDLDDNGYVQTSTAGDAWATTATAADGVFAAGDVMDREYQQAVTAASMGSMAALDTEKWLESAEAAATDSTGPIPTEADD
jgi:thioredoxin reductase (NADPH)